MQSGQINTHSSDRSYTYTHIGSDGDHSAFCTTPRGDIQRKLLNSMGRALLMIAHASFPALPGPPDSGNPTGQRCGTQSPKVHLRNPRLRHRGGVVVSRTFWSFTSTHAHTHQLTNTHTHTHNCISYACVSRTWAR